ncbi:DUF1592 domain-containing protein [Paludisphaera rhizosphaerae]|uniref:DUF1592 domain-containing protein n=1 Tax=Paludisphaera rhizosphaerae TaxID=2711216 RepID=UPI001F0FD425|nr:DUF1592 domain-containing protein [Paludisphaera rhizosphaerae]
MPVVLALAMVALSRPVQGDEATKGKAIYLKQCASCHGLAGEGAEDYPHALVGDKSIKELAKYIAKTMPEDDPGTCVGDDADEVAAYIHDAFYSSVAQARNKPARIELSRLTVRQHQNALADLIGSFRGSMEWDGPKGLQGDYFKSQRSRQEDRLIDRVDPSVQFDFGVNLPGSDEVGHRFFIRWQGGVLAPDSGDYEFVVRTEHSVKLWVNDLEKPLIDRWVKSGKDNEYRETIRLIGGRVYPIRMEMAKGKQGVNDDKKKGPPPPTPASIALLWKRPKGVVETLSARYLSPKKTPEVFVLHTPFPPDDRSMGYERGTSVSRAWDEAATDAALETAGYVVDHLNRLAETSTDASDRREKVQAFCKRFVERAFRRPLDDEQKQMYVDRRFGDGVDLEIAVKRVVLSTLLSPAFLYQEASANPDQYDLASRLSFGLWDSIPDQELLEAAAKGELKNRDQVAKQAERMVNDVRTKAKLREFLLQWLRVDRVADLSKDPKAFPEFDEATAADLRTSLEMFLDDVAWSDGSDFRRFLESDELYLNGRLGKLYGASLPADAPFQKIKLSDEPRAGLLTHPYLMASFAYTATSSPIHRGVFLARGVLGRALAAPPAAVAPLAPDLHAGLTTRERVALQTSPKECRMCHDMINSVGFTLENFDALGRFRKEENGKPIDASGTYQATSGESIVLRGPRELADYLVKADETRTAFSQQLFHNLVKQPVNAFGPDELKKLATAFEKADFNIRKLMVEMMADSATASRQPAEKTVAATP